MIVTCQAGGTRRPCQYNKDGYCTAKVVNINDKCVCSHLFIKGNFDPTAFTPIDDEYRDLTQVPMSEEEYAALGEPYVFEDKSETDTHENRIYKRKATRRIRRIARSKIKRKRS